MNCRVAAGAFQRGVAQPLVEILGELHVVAEAHAVFLPVVILHPVDEKIRAGGDEDDGDE